MCVILCNMTHLSDNLTEAFPRLLREKSIEAIEAHGMSRDDLAEKLDLFPAGVDRILSQKEWPANLGLRVLEALEVQVDIQFPEHFDL